MDDQNQSQSKQSESQTEPSTNSPEIKASPSTQEKKLIRHNAKMISLILLEVNNRFMSVFAEEDANDFRDALTESFNSDVASGKVKNKDINNMARNIDAQVVRYRQQNKRLTDTLLKTVNGCTQAMTEEGRNKFMAIADTLQFLTIEMNNSKNPKQMLSACQLYNAGIFDKALEEVEKMRNDSGLSVPQGLVDLQGNKL